MSEQRLAAMDEVRLERLNLEIYDYLERIKVILSQMEELVSQSKTYFDCDSGNLYRSKFQDAFSEQKNVIENIENINEDIIIVRNTYYAFDEKEHDEIETDTNNLDIKTDYDFHSTINSSKD